MFPESFFKDLVLDRAIEQGVTLEQLHAAGYDMRVMDYIGLDTILNGYMSNQENISSDFAPPKILTELVKQGNLGCKTGRGIYEWDESGNAIIRETRAEQKTLDFMAENMDSDLFRGARLNEACRLLDMGAVREYEVINEAERIGESREGIFALGWDKYGMWSEKLERAADKIGKPYFETPAI